MQTTSVLAACAVCVLVCSVLVSDVQGQRRTSVNVNANNGGWGVGAEHKFGKNNRWSVYGDFNRGWRGGSSGSAGLRFRFKRALRRGRFPSGFPSRFPPVLCYHDPCLACPHGCVRTGHCSGYCSGRVY